MLYDDDIVIKDEEVKLDLNGKDVSTILGLDDIKQMNKQSVNHYEVDLDLYDDIYNSSPVIRRSVEEGNKSLGVFDKLNKDLFLGLYKGKTEIVKESTMTKSTVINNMLMKDIVKNDDFLNLRKNCRLDEFNSMLGTEALNKGTIELIEDWKEEIKSQLIEKGLDENSLDCLQQLSDQEDELIKNLDALQTTQEMKDSLNPDDKDALDKLNKIEEIYKDKIQENKNNLNNLGNQMDQVMTSVPNLVPSLKSKFENLLQRTNSDISDIIEELEGWGFEDGTNGRISYAEKKQAIERIRKSEKLKKLTDKIGKFRDSALACQKRKSNDTATAIKSVTIGGNINRTLPSEKMKLCNEVTKKDFIRKMTQKELLEYKLISHNEKCKGPIVCCIDTSGSMSGSREMWSKAVAIAMLEIAHNQKRDFAGILFSHRVNDEDVIIIDKDKIEPQKVLDLAESFDGGGTDFEIPLDKAMKIINDQKFKKADIIFLTDGECDLSSYFLSEFKKQKEDKDVNVFSILINTGKRVSDSTLKLFSDKIITLAQLRDLDNANSDVVKEIFSLV